MLYGEEYRGSNLPVRPRLWHARLPAQTGSRHQLKLGLSRLDHSSKTSECSVGNNMALSLFAFPLSSCSSHMYVLVARWQECLTLSLWWKSPGQRLVNHWVWPLWGACWSAPLRLSRCFHSSAWFQLKEVQQVFLSIPTVPVNHCFSLPGSDIT